ncbi:MAG: aminoacyl-tRNA hydrolase [bacterium]|nr:aminoacyl-tRNA hydrolase [bacterium]
MYIIVGLGNPGEEYAHTRHNTGRLTLVYLEKKELKGLKFVHLDTFMNKSGEGVKKILGIKADLPAEARRAKAGKLIVIHDDLDLPLGGLKISYGRGSGGHKGVESIIKAIKTKDFIRIRIGIGKKGEAEKYILGQFKKSEMEVLKKVFKKANDAVQMIVEEGLAPAMTEFNA